MCQGRRKRVEGGGGGAGESVLPLQILARIDKNLFVLEESLNR